MKEQKNIRINKLTKSQISEMREIYKLNDTEIITMAVNMFYESKINDIKKRANDQL